MKNPVRVTKDLCRARASTGYRKTAGMTAWCEDRLQGMDPVKIFKAGEGCRGQGLTSKPYLVAAA